MLKEQLAHAKAYLVVILLSCGTLLAAGPARVPQAVADDGSAVVQPLDAAPPAGLVTIYNNLGPKGDVYDSKLAWAIFGPDTGLGEFQWIAGHFVPKANSTITKIKIPIGWDGPGFGPNGVTLAIFTDGGFKPGKLIHEWVLTNLFTWDETCCDIDIVNDKAGVAVQAGTRYWVVAKTGSATTQTTDVWAYAWNHRMGFIAYNLGKGWKYYPKQVIPAFALYGTTP